MSRGSVSLTVRPGPAAAADRFTVSRDATAATAAPASAAAAIVRVMRSLVTNGRAASWITMMSLDASTELNALATES